MFDEETEILYSKINYIDIICFILPGAPSNYAARSAQRSPPDGSHKRRGRGSLRCAPLSFANRPAPTLDIA